VGVYSSTGTGPTCASRVSYACVWESLNGQQHGSGWEGGSFFKDAFSGRFLLN